MQPCFAALECFADLAEQNHPPSQQKKKETQISPFHTGGMHSWQRFWLYPASSMAPTMLSGANMHATHTRTHTMAGAPLLPSVLFPGSVKESALNDVSILVHDVLTPHSSPAVSRAWYPYGAASHRHTQPTVLAPGGRSPAPSRCPLGAWVLPAWNLRRTTAVEPDRPGQMWTRFFVVSP